MTKKKTKRKRKKKKSFSANTIAAAFIFSALAGLILFSNVSFFKNFVKGKQKSQDYKHTQSIYKITSTPVLLPTPPIKTEPTFTVYNKLTAGFCLNVPILLYHHIQPSFLAREKWQTDFSVDNTVFDQQMEYLKNSGYSIISGKQLIDALISHSQLPPKSIVITLDDGYRDVYEYAFPVFKKYSIVANLMISTGLVGGKDYLTWPQIEEMAKSGLVYFTDHTWSHYAVTKGSDDKIIYEIEIARKQLEEHTGQKIDEFAYPYGSFDDNAINILKESGFKGAFSTLTGSTQCDSNVMTLHRKRIGSFPLSAYGL